MNKRKPTDANPGESLDESITNKVSIIEDITGSGKSLPAPPLALVPTTSQNDNPKQQPEVTSESDKSKLEETPTSDNTVRQAEDTNENSVPQTQAEETSETDKLDTSPANTLAGIISDIKQEAKKKKTKADTHTKTTYEIRNNLLKRFDAIAKGQPRGFKEKVINSLLDQFLNEVEDQKRK